MASEAFIGSPPIELVATHSNFGLAVESPPRRPIVRERRERRDGCRDDGERDPCHRWQSYARLKVQQDESMRPIQISSIDLGTVNSSV